MERKMINSLTQEQIDSFPAYVEKWLTIGLSTEPLDFERAKAAVIKCYEIAELPPPKYFYRFESPYSAAMAATLLKSTGAQVWDQVWAQVWDQVGDQVGAQVGAQVWAQVWDQVRAQVGAQVWAQVGAQVRAQVWDQVGAQVYGAHDSEWLAFYDFMLSELKIKECKKLNGLMELARYCGWWAPYENAVILQDRPSKIKFDDQKRLHSEDGPSIEYRDGFSVYSWHGTRIPEAWIKSPNELTPEIALTHENVEQRRAACEILGWETILNKLNAITIDRDEDPLVGELVEVDIPEIGREKFLRVTCGTGRKFALPVPPEMKTALQSNAWTYGLDGCEYNPEIRT